MAKLQFLVFFVFITFTIHTGLSANIPEQYTNTLSQVKERLSLTITNHTETLVKGKESLKTLISIAKDSLADTMEQVRLYITETKAEAEEENIDVSNCTDITILDTINLDLLDTCAIQPTINYLSNELIILSQIYATYHEYMNACIDPDNEMHTATCLDIKVKNLNLQIGLLDVVIDKFLQTAYTLCFDCVKYHLQNLDKEVVAISKSFINCTDPLMRYN